MPGITALLHTKNDGLRIGRCLETLYPCDEILIVDYDSDDRTLRVAQEYGARVVRGKSGTPSEQYLRLSRMGWILTLDPRESLTEGLAASLYEWKSEAVAGSAFSMFLREETVDGWVENPAPQTRLVRVGWERWQGHLPAHEASALALEGELLRFALP